MVKSTLIPDFSVLQDDVVEKQGKKHPNKIVCEFNETVSEQLSLLNLEVRDSTTSMYEKPFKSIQYTAENVLPKTKKNPVIKRHVSKKALFLLKVNETIQHLLNILENLFRLK